MPCDPGVADCRFGTIHHRRSVYRPTVGLIAEYLTSGTPRRDPFKTAQAILQITQVDDMEVATANLIDPAADKLLKRFERSSRLEAARDAKAWWEEDNAATIDLASATATFGGSLELRAGIEELRTHGFELVWTEMGTKDAPLWMVDVLNEDGEIVASGLGNNRDDAVLEVAEALQPPDHS